MRTLPILLVLLLSGCGPIAAGVVAATSGGGGGGGSSGGAATSPLTVVAEGLEPSTVGARGHTWVSVFLDQPVLPPPTGVSVRVGGQVLVRDKEWFFGQAADGGRVRPVLSLWAPPNPRGNRTGEVQIEVTGAVRVVGRPEDLRLHYEAYPAAVFDASPRSGPYTGGTLITIDGDGFGEGVRVHVGGAEATVLEVAPTRILARTAAVPRPALSAPILVEHPDGVEVTQGAYFTFKHDPVVAMGTPLGGETLGGTFTVRWITVDPTASTVDVLLSTDGGATFPVVLAANVQDVGQLGWDTLTVSDGDDYRLRVVSTDVAGSSFTAESGSFQVRNTPTVLGARFEDRDRDAALGAGDAVVVVFSVPVVVNGATPADLSLPVSGDTFGVGAAVSAGPGANEVTVTLGTGAALTAPGDFAAGSLAAGSPSGVDVAASMISNAIEAAATGRDAAPAAPVDLTPGLVDTAHGFTSTAAMSARLADLDGDGDLDLVMSHGNAGPFVVYRQDPTGLAFANAFGGACRSFVLVDVDRDGDLDIVGVEEPLYINQGGMSFMAQGVDVPGQEVAAGDVDGDGVTDVVVGRSPGFRVLRGDGAGGFTEDAVLHGADFSSSMTLADLDLDGDLDLVRLAASVVGSDVSDRVEVWTNDGAGAFSGPTTLMTARERNLAAAGVSDLDGDGDPDLVVVGGAYGAVWIWANAGDGSFGAPRNLPGGPSGGVAIADLDGDGDEDLVTATGVAFNHGGLTFRSGSVSFPTPSSSWQPRGLAVGDLDGDGDLDVVVPSFTSGKTSRIFAGSLAGSD